MSHKKQTDFFIQVIKSFPRLFMEYVIDIGNMNLNGSPADLIQPKNCVGVDIGPGPNVDLVSSGHLLDSLSE